MLYKLQAWIMSIIFGAVADTRCFGYKDGKFAILAEGQTGLGILLTFDRVEATKMRYQLSTWLKETEGADIKLPDEIEEGER